jgi:hypothetical protein
MPVVEILQLQGPAKPLQFKDQRRALRPDRSVVQWAGPARRHCLVLVRTIYDLHDGAPSASFCGWLAFADGCAGRLAAAAWLLTLRTRANTSSLGPNAIALPS